MLLQNACGCKYFKIKDLFSCRYYTLKINGLISLSMNFLLFFMRTRRYNRGKIGRYRVEFELLQQGSVHTIC